MSQILSLTILGCTRILHLKNILFILASCFWQKLPLVLLSFAGKISKLLTRVCQKLDVFVPEVYWRPLHVDGGDFQGDGFDLRQEVEVHEVLLTKDARPLPPAVDGGGFDDQLDLRNP